MSKKKTALVVAFVLMGVAVLGLAAAVYAKYIASLQASGEASIAKWDFEGENTNTTVTCNITSNPVSGTVASGKMAPGTSGECTLSLANTHSEVAVDYTIKANAGDSANIPANLQLKANSGDEYSTLDDFVKSGSIAAGGAATTVTIYWNWPYETGTAVNGIAPGDEDDTDAGEAAYTGENAMLLVFDVSGVQHNPANALN